MALVKTYRELDIWQKGMDLAAYVYEITKVFPKEEKFGLTSQMRRCAVSITSNIAEGTARNSYKDFINFLHYTLGSVAELETQLLLSHKFGYIKDDHHSQLEEIRRKTLNYIKYLKTKL